MTLAGEQSKRVKKKNRICPLTLTYQTYQNHKSFINECLAVKFKVSLVTVFVSESQVSAEHIRHLNHNRSWSSTVGNGEQS